MMFLQRLPKAIVAPNHQPNKQDTFGKVETRGFGPNYQNTNGNVLSKVLPFVQDDGAGVSIGIFETESQ